MKNEIWKPVLDYEERYEVSDQGRVRSIPRPGRGSSYRILKPGRQRIYHCVSLFKTKDKSSAKTKKVHLLVLEAFTGIRRVKGMEAGHRNGIATDNRLENLYWTDRIQNEKDKIKHGTFICGEKSCKAKLKEHEVLTIHRKAHAGEDPEVLAKQYGIHPGTVGAIKSERTWRHLWK